MANQENQNPNPQTSSDKAGWFTNTVTTITEKLDEHRGKAAAAAGFAAGQWGGKANSKVGDKVGFGKAAEETAKGFDPMSAIKSVAGI